jgi:predicted nuclease with TOPRIM domain
MSDELSAEELERLRKMTALGKVSLGIVLKWTWLFAVVFLVLFAGASWYLVRRSARSDWRFTATTRLMYMPFQGTKVPAMGDKQLFRVLDRRSLKVRVKEKIPLPEGEDNTLGGSLEIHQERQPSTIYTLVAHSGSQEAAVRKANAYAAILISEYGEWRVKDLNRWNGDAADRRARLLTERTRIENEIANLKIQAGTDTPVETQTALNTLISEERRNLLMLDVEIETAEKTRESLKGDAPKVAAELIARAPELRKLKAAIEELDDEIAKLRQIYTDLNPRVQGKLDDRAELEKRYQEIVAECGGEAPGEDQIRRMERDQTSVLDITSKLEALKEARKNLEETLKGNEERAKVLLEVAPQVMVLAHRRRDLEFELEELDEQISNASHMLENAQSELQQLEPAVGAVDRWPYRTENFVFAAAAAGGCTGALALVVVVSGLLFGRVRGAQELAAAGDIRVLGSIPGRWAIRRHREEAKEAMGVVANHFMEAPESKGVVMVCRLKGAKPEPMFEEELDWALSMSGVRSFTLTVVREGNRDVPQEGVETMLNTVRKGPKGWFPVVNRYSLAPTELQMLAADIAALRSEFDCIFLAVHGGLRRGGDFTGQLLGLCDSALLLAGTNRTRRSELTYARRLAKAAGKPLMGLVTGARTRVMRKELEESRW